MKDLTIHIDRKDDVSLNITEAGKDSVRLEFRINGVSAETTVPIALFESFKRKK